MSKNRRHELNAILVDILGSENVYFQPPESVKISYPAIVYARENTFTRYANDNKYISKDRYRVTVISKDPDSPIPDMIARLPYTSFNRTFSKDNLHHTIYTLYF